MSRQPAISDDMFTNKELDDLYGTNFAFHENLPESYSTHCFDVPDEIGYADEISYIDDKYDHDIERLMV